VSTPVVTRADFQQLADVRLQEAKALLDLGLWDGAYYLAGYAVEVALKACIIKAVMATDAFPEKKFSENCWTHDLEKLIVLAGVKGVWDAALKADPNLRANWVILEDWSEQTRYHRISEPEARDLYDAISDATHGVLTWIKAHW
jgi:HEPN domain-containing protein